MRAAVLGMCAVVLALGGASCGRWNDRGGAVTLPASHSHVPTSANGAGPPGGETPRPAPPKVAAPCRVSFEIPRDWSWVMRGDDFIATRDGVFLQNITVERIHVDQFRSPVGPFLYAAFSSKQWPLRTVLWLRQRFQRGMTPTEAAEAFLQSRKHDPGAADVEVRETAPQDVAGTPGFRVVFDMRVKGPAPASLYRSVYCGFVRDEWFYGIGYTAPLRHYFGKDAGTFESVLRSVALTAP